VYPAAQRIQDIPGGTPMALANYGLLTGKIVEHGMAAEGNPHYFLFVRAGAIRYRVALNVETTRPGRGPSPATLQYQIVENLRSSKLRKAQSLARFLANRNSFELASENPRLPRLDYVRGGIVPMSGFHALPLASGREAANNFLKRLVAALAHATKDKDAYVAVFGSGYASERTGTNASALDPAHSSTGFTGVENVHMNQGSLYQIGHHLTGHFAENGPDQDGGLLIVGKDAVRGYFAKFTSQDNETDANGNPVHTGVQALDRPARKRKFSIPANPYAYLMPAAKRAKKRQVEAQTKVPPPVAVTTPVAEAAPATSQAVPGDYVFADPGTGNDPIRPFKPDDDSAVRNYPFVANFAKHGVPEPVPAPRGGTFPLMSLKQVMGQAATKAIRDSGQMVFHAVGDTGAPAQSKLPNETDVANLMLEDFRNVPKEERPAFYYHLGDVVYYYGE